MKQAMSKLQSSGDNLIPGMVNPYRHGLLKAFIIYILVFFFCLGLGSLFDSLVLLNLEEIDYTYNSIH